MADNRGKRSRIDNFIGWVLRLFTSTSARQIQNASPQEPEPYYFGVPLSTICSDDARLEDNIPLPLFNAANALQNFLTIEGLFRVSGIFSEMNKMKGTFESKEIPDFSNVNSVHSIAGFIEMWLRELPEPLTTHDLYDEFTGCIKENENDEDLVKKLSECVKKLPECNRVVLAFFLRLMKQIAENADENKMNEKNLGVVFGSVLLGSSVFSFSLDMKQQLQNQNIIIQTLISNVDTFFPLEEYPYPIQSDAIKSSE